jgi:hypothetical protein
VEISRIVCMQCGRVIRETKVKGGLVSHGLCIDCAEVFAREIDSIDPAEPVAQPVLAVEPYPALSSAG